jgi:hypothetical protein
MASKSSFEFTGVGIFNLRQLIGRLPYLSKMAATPRGFPHFDSLGLIALGVGPGGISGVLRRLKYTGLCFCTDDVIQSEHPFRQSERLSRLIPVPNAGRRKARKLEKKL